MSKSNIIDGLLVKVLDDKCDTAEFIMMALDSKANLGNNILQKKIKIQKENIINNKFGNLIGTVSVKGIGMFHIYVGGTPDITNNLGVKIDSIEIFLDYLLNNRLDELNFASSSYIKVIERDNEFNYHGIFSSIKEMLNYLTNLSNQKV